MTPQTGFHVPDGVEMNREQAMPDCFENHHKYVGKCPYCHTVLAETAMPLDEALAALTQLRHERDEAGEGTVKALNEVLRLNEALAAVERERDAAYSKGYHQAVFDKLPDLAAVERERDGWLRIVGDIAALVPIPEVFKATGKTGDLIAWLKDRVACAAASEANVLALTTALTESRKQLTAIIDDGLQTDFRAWRDDIDAALQTEGRADE